MPSLTAREDARTAGVGTPVSVQVVRQGRRENLVDERKRGAAAPEQVLTPPKRPWRPEMSC